MPDNANHPRIGKPEDASLADRVQRMVQSERGADARVIDFGVMEDGHAGLTFGFDVVRADGAPVGSYVLKMAPAGVVRRGNTDVYRQVPLLRALKQCGLPVPEIPWASPDEDQLGTPFLVMERLPGRVFVVWEPHASFSRDPAHVREIWLQAAALLARVHLIDWPVALRDWEKPRALPEELDRWTKLLRHAEDPDWHAAGTRLGTLLGRRMPDDAPVGLVHGDFQPGNILYEDGRAGGLIDWELASIGAQGLDLGWMLMMIDALAWHPDWRPVASISAADLIGSYRRSGGPGIPEPGMVPGARPLSSRFDRLPQCQTASNGQASGCPVGTFRAVDFVSVRPRHRPGRTRDRP